MFSTTLRMPQTEFRDCFAAVGEETPLELRIGPRPRHDLRPTFWADVRERVSATTVPSERLSSHTSGDNGAAPAASAAVSSARQARAIRPASRTTSSSPP